MKLFIWNNPYRPQYGGAIIYAVAETVEEARAVAQKAPIMEFGEPGTQDAQDTTVAIAVGEPDRVCDLPYAEIYEWSE